MLGELNPCGGGDVIPLMHDRLLVGRRSSCDICLTFPNVSSHHCMLELKDGYWHVRDLGSRNGIKVNGERVDGKFLMPGDVLHVARNRYEVRYKPIATGPAPEEENPFAMGLLEKAGLETDRPRPDQGTAKQKRRDKATVRHKQSAEDEFLMEWLGE